MLQSARQLDTSSLHICLELEQKQKPNDEDKTHEPVNGTEDQEDDTKDESTEELQPSVDGNRQVGLFEPDEDAQGGPAKSKLELVI